MSNSDLTAKADNKINEWTKRIAVAATRVLTIAGEAAIAEARKSGSYTDQTGNLRSSVGYAMVGQQAGKVDTVAGFKGTQAGQVEGEAAARKLALSANPNTLIVVAGMKYGKYVQAKGYNVLYTAEQVARNTLTKMGLKV
jgi:hypothetical protein